MSFKRHIYLIIVFLMLISFTVIISGSDAFATEQAGKGRKIWDNIMLWVNFGILVFFFIKFAKKPLMDFLNGERGKIEKTIDSVDEELERAKSRMELEEDKLKNIDAHIQKDLEAIIEIGKREREQIIEEAKFSADLMIDEAKKVARNNLDLARKKFGEKMLDMAISIAVENIKKSISSEENERIIDQFSTGLSTQKVFSITREA
ncbi:MAG: ATP synthase F0 subunit B [Deltaproteobacteria bacterium]|nr:ATP synthase F0 subunit B [Deltaproteobacteria bacterium]